MTARRQGTCPGGVPGNGEMLISDAGLDPAETDCLALARRFFALMSEPDAPHPYRAGVDTVDRFVAVRGLEAAFAMSRLLGEIRQNRRAPFIFSNPDCPDCARVLTEHERRLTGALAALRRGRMSTAHVQVMLLCEGNPGGAVLDAATQLATLLPPPGASERISKEWTEH